MTEKTPRDMGRKPEQSSLFPHGFDSAHLPTMLKQYLMYVDSMEKTVARRQTMVSFFLTLNGLLLTGLGLLAKEAGTTWLVAVGTGTVSLVGVLVCVVWMRLAYYYRQLNAAKFEVIHEYETHLPSAPFHCEWIMLGKGKEPQRYVSHSGVERRVSMILAYGYAVSFVASVAVVIFMLLGAAS